MKKLLFTFLLIMGIFYLIGCFNALTFNPTHWTDLGRALYSVLGTCIALVVALKISEFNEQQESNHEESD